MHLKIKSVHWFMNIVGTTLCWIATYSGKANGFSEGQVRYFESKIRPLLIDRCYDCHSAASQRQEAGLRLDSRDHLIEGGKSGAALVPGAPEESLLLQIFSAGSEREVHPAIFPALTGQEMALLRRWIEDEAAWPATRKRKSATGAYDWEEEKRHWAYRPIEKPESPLPPNSLFRIKNPIDLFVVARLDQAGLPQAEPARAEIFVRRAFLDLIGLPPSASELAQWSEQLENGPKASLDDGAVARMIDALLARPQYGERWARHWLDVARYSEIGGWTQDGRSNPMGFHYRDWVIRAFNEDMPFSAFIRHQIAGDHLDSKAAVGTGFLALGPNYTSDGGDPESIAQAKGETLDDRVDTFSRGLLGLTVSCSRCHDHKFDAIPIEDYYSIAGVFNNTREGETPLVDASSVRAFEEGQKRIRAFDARLKERRKAAKGLEGPAGEKAKDEITEMEEAFKRVKAEAPAKYAYAHTLHDTDDKDMHVALRGNLLKKGDLAPRRFLRILAGEDRQHFDRGSGRAQLAEAVADLSNPLSNRVFVNRVWMHHFGRALVRTPDNFGKLGQKPTHPMLLDWVAANFVESGGSLKQLHRLIMTSATYRSSSRFVDLCFSVDADNRLLWRMDPRRMDVETWRDSLLTVTGELDLIQGGPSVNNIASSHRRTLYARISRNDPTESDKFLRLFDFPIPRGTAAKRTRNVIPQQYLFMLNSPFMVDRAKALTKRVEADFAKNTGSVDAVYRLIHGRSPSEEETRAAETFLDQSDGKQSALSPWELYCQALLASNEFMYIR